MKKKNQPNMKVQWTKFIVVLVLYLAFLWWLKSWLGLIVVPFIYDAYISRKIRWSALSSLNRWSHLSITPKSRKPYWRNGTVRR